MLPFKLLQHIFLEKHSVSGNLKRKYPTLIPYFRNNCCLFKLNPFFLHIKKISSNIIIKQILSENGVGELSTFLPNFKNSYLHYLLS